MITEAQHKVLSRLAHLKEFAPCNTTDFDHLLQSKGLVKINKQVFQEKEYFDTTLTQDGLNKLSHLVEESRI